MTGRSRQEILHPAASVQRLHPANLSRNYAPVVSEYGNERDRRVSVVEAGLDGDGVVNTEDTPCDHS